MNAPSLTLSPRVRSQRFVEWLQLGYFLPFLVFAVCVIATYLLWQNAQQGAEDELRDRFYTRVHGAVEAIEKRMKTYEQVMRGVQGVVDESVNERDHFRAYFENLKLDQGYPGIHSVGFAPIVRDTEKDRHIAAVRKEGFPEYTITPQGKRPIYIPSKYIEPFNKQARRALGYDMYSEPELRAAMERARDSGSAAVTGKVKLAQETDEYPQAAFMMFLPVYNFGAPHNTLDERRARLMGWVYATFRADDLMAGIGSESDADFDFDIYDGEEVSEKSMLYDPHARPTNIPPEARFQITLPIAVTDHGWTMVALSLPAFEARLGKEKQQIIANAGAGISLLLTLLTWLLVYGRIHALHAAAAVARESRRNETLLRTASDGIYVFDLEGNMVQVNDAFCRMLGCTRKEILIMNVAQWHAQWTKDKLMENIAALESSNPVFATRYRRFDGSIIDVEISASRVEIGDQQLIYNSVRDITERKKIEEKLQKADKERALLAVRREEEERLRAIIDTAMDAVVQMDSEGKITGWNKQASNIFGWSREQAVGQPMHEIIIPPQFRNAHIHGLKRFLSSGGVHAFLNSRVEIQGMHQDGHELPIELSITSVTKGGQIEFNAFIRDISERKISEELIWKQANFDTLTQLPNRRMFHDRLAQEIKKANRNGLPLALLFIDLDRFKEVNDTLGHDIGDTLLVEAAQRIAGCVREADTVARLGGDEFTVILADYDEIGSVERVTENILMKLAEPFQLGNEVTYVSASIGITLYPNDATDMESLLKNADQAMYVAKKQGRNRFSYFTQQLQAAALARLRMTNDLRGALAANQLMVYFQPIVNLATGRIQKAEALIRWQHPEKGLIYPEEFILLAEETGLIYEIGDWVFKESARWVKRWRTELDNAEFQVSVNKSPVQFRELSGHPNTWLAHIKEMDLPGNSIVVEITEGLLLAADSPVNAALLRYRDAGIQVAIDDFGTGYSALSYLNKFDIDYLKIDQSFTRNLAPGSSDMALSEAIIVMAHKLGLKVIAEGVETEEQRDLLIAAGCDFAQGYLYSRAVPPEQFEVLLKESLFLKENLPGRAA